MYDVINTVCQFTGTAGLALIVVISLISIWVADIWDSTLVRKLWVTGLLSIIASAVWMALNKFLAS